MNIAWASDQTGSVQGLLEKSGFIRCGTIYVEEDDFPRMAYEKSKTAWIKAGYVCGIS